MEELEFKEVIYRYFRGQLADNEYELLTEALRNKANREYFEIAKSEWENHPELDELGFRNINRLTYHLNNSNSTFRDPKVQSIWVKVSRVAAILILGLVIGSAASYLLFIKSKSEQLVFETRRGEKSLVKLPDGSEIWLNARSRLVYNTFSAHHRQVELKGEAFFKVAHNADAPFVVKTNECDVEVLGTSFNIMAYDEFGRKEITLLDGRVNVIMKGANQVLAPGQALILKDLSYVVQDVNSLESAGWVDNKFNFKNIPLSELMKRLENWYDVDITLENKTGKDLSYSGTFKNEETIWQVLDAIKVYTPIDYKKTNLRQIQITVQFKNNHL